MPYKKIPYQKILAGCLGLAIVMALVAGAGILTKKARPTAASLSNYPVIIIDAGHGGFDGGAVASDGTPEKDINLSIAQNLRDFLLPLGLDIVMVRDTDTGTEDPTADTIRQKKNSDLKNRLKLMNKYSNAIFISIHLNKFPQSEPNGAQVFYTPNVAEAKFLAEEIQANIQKQLQPNNTRVIKQATSDTYLLDNAKVPAVIVECGFLSNPGDLNRLKNEEYQAKMAFTIACGLLNFLKQPDLEVG